MKTTIAEIAQQSGVSVSTVSQVLNGKGRIADATRTKVLQIAESSNYRKNASRNSSRKYTLIPVAALVNTDGDWSFLWNFEREILNAIEDCLYEAGYSLILIPVRKSNSSRDILQKITTSAASAVFPMHYGNEELFTHLHRMGIPVVVVFNNAFTGTYHSVGTHDFACVYDAVIYLRSLGHDSIYYADCTMNNLQSTSEDRLYGYLKGMGVKHPLKVKENIIRFDRNDRQGLKKKLEKICALKGSKKPTALITVDDDAALRIASVFREFGISVPKDISLLAVGDVIDYSGPGAPKISTMKIDIKLAGKTAAEMMTTILGGGSPLLQQIIPYSFTDRGSCAPPGILKSNSSKIISPRSIL